MLSNWHTYIKIYPYTEGICVEFRRKNNTPLQVYLLSNCRQVLLYVKTNLLNIIFDDFNIWLLGYRTVFSCLYLSQGHSFISTVWLWSTDEYVLFVCFWAKGHLKTKTVFSIISKSSMLQDQASTPYIALMVSL